MDLKLTNLESTPDIDATKTVAATLHDAWRKKDSSGFVITTQQRRAKKEEEAFKKYLEQGESRARNCQVDLPEMRQI